MRLLLAAAGALTALAAPAFAGSPPMLDGVGATATASPAAAGARSALTLKLTYPMTCGQPGRGPVTVTLPPGTQVPQTIAAASVLVRGKAAPSVSVAGRVVTVGLPRPPQVLCQSIVTGTLKIVFMRAADLANPSAAGSYAVVVHIGRRTFRAPLAIG